jgi:hypothetical protein
VRRAAAGVAVSVVIAAVVGLWIADQGPADLTGAKLTVKAAPGRADTTEEGPAVPMLAPGDPLHLTARLCPKKGGRLEGPVHTAVWSAPGRGEWTIRYENVPLVEAGEGCREAKLEADAARMWPGTEKGVVRWAFVAGPGASEPPEGGASAGWRDRGLLVVDGEVIRVPDVP